MGLRRCRRFDLGSVRRCENPSRTSVARSSDKGSRTKTTECRRRASAPSPSWVGHLKGRNVAAMAPPQKAPAMARHDSRAAARSASCWPSNSRCRLGVSSVMGGHLSACFSVGRSLSSACSDTRRAMTCGRRTDSAQQRRSIRVIQVPARFALVRGIAGHGSVRNGQGAGAKREEEVRTHRPPSTGGEGARLRDRPERVDEAGLHAQFTSQEPGLARLSDAQVVISPPSSGSWLAYAESTV